MFGLFIIEAGSEPKPVLNREGKPMVYENGRDAATNAEYACAGNHWELRYEPIKCQVRRIADDAWKARELARFDDGTYTKLPWPDLPDNPLCNDHFAHVSTEDGAKIAYTQDAAKGAGDIQTRVRPGKYLTQFYSSHFDAATIARMAAEFSNQYGEKNELLFADTQEDIVRVYNNGPRSCMSYEASHFSSSIHPVSIYAAGDLAVAYMVREGSITARTLCWPEKKLFSRIYGDETRLLDLLETAGYSSGHLYGAKMLRIQERRGFVCPYVDGHEVEDDGEFLILSREGDVRSDSQNGLTRSCVSCCNCDCDVDEDDAHSDDNGDYYCEDCYDETFGYCDYYEERCHRSDMSEVRVLNRHGRYVDQSWSQSAVENHAFQCDGNGNLYHNDLLVTMADGSEWSQEHFEDNGFICEGNSEPYPCDEMVQLEDGTTWSQDYFDDHGVTIDGKHYDKDNAPDTDDDDGEAKPHRASPTVHCEAQTELPLPRPIKVGDWVRYIGPNIPGQFHEGRLYLVTRTFTDYGEPRINVSTDDSGRTTNGFVTKFFVHSLDPIVTEREVA